MFFQSIYQMIATGTDLSINIRKVNNKLSVAVIPKRTSLKDEAGQLLVPLILNGTPEELDAEFLQTVTTPVQKVERLFTNLEMFEEQARQAASQSKTTKTTQKNESKEAREKQEKIEKLVKKADEAITARKYSEALIWLKQARGLATIEKHKEIDAKVLEVQKKASEGSLFAEQVFPPQQQPINNYSAHPKPGEQIQMFSPQPISQSSMVQQPYPNEVIQPQTMEGQYYQQPKDKPGWPGTGQQQIYFQQAVPQPIPQTPVMQTVQENTRREYRSQPSQTESFSFDKDDENDREILKEDPYAEYLDFPQEYRMKDEAQIELVCC